MRKGSALAVGIVMALATIARVQAGPISFDPTGGSAEAVAAVESAIRVFESAFASRAECVGSVSVIFEPLAGRQGEYRTADAVVAINPERKVETMESTLYHELAHHTMLSCRAYRDSDFKTAFYAAQNIPSDRGWFDNSAGWSGIPAEHFAEVAVLLVQGSTDGRIAISREASGVMRRWLNGQPMASVAAGPVEEDVAVSGVASEPDSVAAPFAPTYVVP